MVQVIEQSLPFGKLAESFGKSLGEGIGQQARQEMLSTGIEQVTELARQSGQYSPIGLYSQLLRVPGMDPQMAQQILPFVQSQLQVSELQQRYKELQALDASESAREAPLVPEVEDTLIEKVVDVPEAPTLPVQRLEEPKKPIEQKKVKEAFTSEKILGFNPDVLTTTESVEQAKQSIPVITERDVDIRASQLLEQQPARFGTNLDKARDFARRELDNQREQKLAIIDRRGREVRLLDDTRNEFDRRLSELKPEARQDLDRAYGRLQRMGEELVAEGKGSPEKISKLLTQKASDFLKQKSNLLKFGTGSIFGMPANDLLNKMRKARSAYEDVNSLDLLSEELQSNNGLSPHLANSVSYPIYGDVFKQLEDLPRYKSKAALSVAQADKVNKEKRAQTERFVKDLIPKIKPDQSIYAIALGLDNKGYDEKILYRVLNEAIENNEWAPSNVQEQELTQAEPVKFTMEDIFSSTFFGWLKGSPQTPTSTKISRTVLKKR